jgi:hypothetical protein
MPRAVAQAKQKNSVGVTVSSGRHNHATLFKKSGVVMYMWPRGVNGALFL